MSIKEHPRARVVWADMDGNPIYSTNGHIIDVDDAVRTLEYWNMNRELTIAEVSRDLGIPEHRVSRYFDLMLFKKPSDNCEKIRLISKV